MKIHSFSKVMCSLAPVCVILLLENKIQAQTLQPIINYTAPINSGHPLPSPYLPSSNLNFIRTWNALVPTTSMSWLTADTRKPSEAQMATQYFDGLGASLQEVARHGAGAGKDLVNTHVYDASGKELVTYLPYVSTVNTGRFKVNPFQEQQSFYGVQQPGETFLYNEQKVEPSPDARQVQGFNAGNSWVGTNRGTQKSYMFNLANEVFIIEADFTNGAIQVAGYYQPTTLYKLVTRDENGNTTEEFKNKEGQVIAKRVQQNILPSNGIGAIEWLTTYYVYDDANRLRFVVSPLANQQLERHWFLSQDVINELCYEYRYDDFGKMIYKKVPGAEYVLLVYDKYDRLVLTQDGSMRKAGFSWLATKYDEQNRPMGTYFWYERMSYDDIVYQALTDDNFPYVDKAHQLTETFYDNYSWLYRAGAGWSSSIDMTVVNNSGAFTNPINTSPLYAQPMQSTAYTTGMVTGTMVRILSTNNFIYAASYYDDKGRVLQTKQQNHLGGEDIISIQYSFIGKPLTTHHLHKANGTANVVTTTKTTYDELWRPTQITKQINNQSPTTIASIQYNSLGQLQQKNIGLNSHGQPLETLEHSYNIRGWLTAVNKNYVTGMLNTSPNWFGMTLSYDQGFTQNQYNGNISGQIWRTKGSGGKKRAYGYSYDAANRLLKADFTEGDITNNFSVNSAINFNVRMGDGLHTNTAYDANGNILRMQQFGLVTTTSAQIDDLYYTYQNSGNSNKLQAVSDATGNTTRLGDFKDANTTVEDYSYDVNGNLVTDANKAITSISYNHLNLPQLIEVAGKGTIQYTYTATGQKLTKTVVDQTASPAKTTVTHYIGGLQYQATAGQPLQLQHIAHEEGRARLVNNTAVYDYFIKDHLGNTRLVLTNEEKTEGFHAGFEQVNEAQHFTNYDNIVDKPTCYTDVAEGTGYTGINQEAPVFVGQPQKTQMVGAAKLAKPITVGVGKLLKVSAGDIVNADVFGWFTSQILHSNPANNQTHSQSILNAITTGAGQLAEGGSRLGANPSAVLAAITSFLNTQTNFERSGGAYLNWIFVNEETLTDAQGVSGYDDFFSEIADYECDGVAGAKHLSTENIGGITIPQNGYLYVFVSNTNRTHPVFFDDFRINITKSPLLEETHYYPFGLTMSGISSKAANIEPNKEKTFQGQRFDDDLGLNWIQFKWRNHDPQIGRFIEIDPLSEKYVYNSTYAFSENKVTTHVELEGLEAEYIFQKAKEEAASAVVGFFSSIDNAISFFTKSSTSTTVAKTPISTTSVGSSVTTTTNTNFGGIMSYIAYNNTNTGNSEPTTKTTTTITSDVKTDVKVAGVTVTNKTSVSTTGVVSTELGAKRTVLIEGVPTTVGGSVSVSSDGKTTATGQATTSIPLSPVQGTGQVQYSTDGKKQSTSIGVGGQATTGKTTTTSIFGIKFSW